MEDFWDDLYDDDWDNLDICCECQGLGDDYSYDDDGDLVSNCGDCIYRSNKDDGWYL